MSKKSKTKRINISFKFKSSLIQLLKSKAANDNRSMNNLVETLLEIALEKEIN